MSKTKACCRALASLVTFVALAAACSSGQKSSGFDEPGGAVPSTRPDEPSASGSPGDGGLPGFAELPDSGGPALCAASVTTAKKAAVDIIVAIDTSGSMSDETSQLKANINDFANTVGRSGLDYQVLMLAAQGTGSLQVCVPPPLGGAACADNPPTFHHFVQSVGSTNALSLVLSTYDRWKQHLRSEAYKVFVVITDDNSSLGSAAFDTQLLAKDPAMFGAANARKYIMNSICGWKDGTPLLSSTKCDTAENTGAVYQELSKLTGGIVDSVCKASFAGVFQNLANGIAARLGCEFDMPVVADGGSAVDPSTVAVRFSQDADAGTASLVELIRVTDASKCSAFADGWYYDREDAPSKILLCPGACSTVSGVTGGSVEIAAGCATPAPR